MHLKSKPAQYCWMWTAKNGKNAESKQQKKT